MQDKQRPFRHHEVICVDAGAGIGDGIPGRDRLSPAAAASGSGGGLNGGHVHALQPMRPAADGPGRAQQPRQQQRALPRSLTPQQGGLVRPTIVLDYAMHQLLEASFELLMAEPAEICHVQNPEGQVASPYSPVLQGLVKFTVIDCIMVLHLTAHCSILPQWRCSSGLCVVSVRPCFPRRALRALCLAHTCIFHVHLSAVTRLCLGVFHSYPLQVCMASGVKLFCSNKARLLVKLFV